MTRIVCRNIVVLVGARYLSVLIGMPFFILFGRLNEGHVYTGELGSLVGTLVSTIPLAVDSVLAGLIGGWLVESPRPHRWAWGFAVLLFLASVSSHHWRIVPSVIDRVGEILEAAIIGIIQVPAFLFAEHRGRRVVGAA